MLEYANDGVASILEINGKEIAIAFEADPSFAFIILYPTPLIQLII